MRLALLTLLALSPTLAAQEYIERFDYPDGTAIPGWTEHQGGDFQIQNKQLILTSGSHSYATIDKFLKIGDCVIDVECIYPAGSGVRYAGASARHDGSATENGLVQLKVQDNSSSGNWNRVFLYERPGSSLYLDMTPPLDALRGAALRQGQPVLVPHRPGHGRLLRAALERQDLR
jgi:hypothetical protein